MSTKNRVIELANYRDKFAKKAAHLFAKLMMTQRLSAEKTSFTLLVIAAGSFPSYLPLVRQLIATQPHLQSIHFTLLEPVASLTDIFLKHFAELPRDLTIAVEFTAIDQDLETYLASGINSRFDMVYFEHPETMTLPIVLAKAGIKSFQRVPSFRKSLPRLSTVLAPNALLLACCMSHHELHQLKNLLNFGLPVKLQVTKSFHPLHYFFGGPFCAGLQGEIGNTCFSKDLQTQRMDSIAQSDSLLFIFLIFSLAIFFWQFMQPEQVAQRTIAVLLIGAQLLWHRPGWRGFLTKMGLLILLGGLAVLKI